MNEKATITDPALFITYWYWGISFFLLIGLSSYAWLVNYWIGIKKIILFLVVFICAFAQFIIFRFGIEPVYNYFGFTVFQDNYIRIPALFFSIAYLVFLPVFYKKKR